MRNELLAPQHNTRTAFPVSNEPSGTPQREKTHAKDPSLPESRRSGGLSHLIVLPAQRVRGSLKRLPVRMSPAQRVRGIVTHETASVSWNLFFSSISYSSVYCASIPPHVEFSTDKGPVKKVLMTHARWYPGGVAKSFRIRPPCVAQLGPCTSSGNLVPPVNRQLAMSVGSKNPIGSSDRTIPERVPYSTNVPSRKDDGDVPFGGFTP